MGPGSKEWEYIMGVMKQYMEDGDLDSAYNICEEYFGLEPDYLI